MDACLLYFIRLSNYYLSSFSQQNETGRNGGRRGGCSIGYYCWSCFRYDEQQKVDDNIFQQLSVPVRPDSDSIGFDFLRDNVSEPTNVLISMCWIYVLGLSVSTVVVLL